MMHVAVKSLVNDAKSYNVSVWAAIGSAAGFVFDSKATLWPYAARRISTSRWRITTTPLGIAPEARPRCSAASTAAASTGGADGTATDVGVGAGRGVAVAGGAVGRAVGAAVGTGVGTVVAGGGCGVAVGTTGTTVGTAGAGMQLAAKLVARNTRALRRVSLGVVMLLAA